MVKALRAQLPTTFDIRVLISEPSKAAWSTAYNAKGKDREDMGGYEIRHLGGGKLRSLTREDWKGRTVYFVCSIHIYRLLITAWLMSTRKEYPYSIEPSPRSYSLSSPSSPLTTPRASSPSRSLRTTSTSKGAYLNSRASRSSYSPLWKTQTHSWNDGLGSGTQKKRSRARLCTAVVPVLQRGRGRLGGSGCVRSYKRGGTS